MGILALAIVRKAAYTLRHTTNLNDDNINTTIIIRSTLQSRKQSLLFITDIEREGGKNCTTLNYTTLLLHQDQDQESHRDKIVEGDGTGVESIPEKVEGDGVLRELWALPGCAPLPSRRSGGGDDLKTVGKGWIEDPAGGSCGRRGWRIRCR